MIATAQLRGAGPGPARALVPLSAVIAGPRGPEAFAVYVVDRSSSVATLRSVVPVQLVGNDVAISEGVTQGQEVVVRGANLIHDGERVAVIP
jgi:multidrug efflux system membrane fusion protein